MWYYCRPHLGGQLGEALEVSLHLGRAVGVDVEVHRIVAAVQNAEHLHHRGGCIMTGDWRGTHEKTQASAKFQEAELLMIIIIEYYIQVIAIIPQYF